MTAIHKVAYLDPFDVDVYQTLKSIQNGGERINLSEKEQNLSFYSSEEIEMIFSEYEDLIRTTEEIASLCDVSIEFGKYHLPKYSSGTDANE